MDKIRLYCWQFANCNREPGGEKSSFPGKQRMGSVVMIL